MVSMEGANAGCSQSRTSNPASARFAAMLNAVFPPPRTVTRFPATITPESALQLAATTRAIPELQQTGVSGMASQEEIGRGRRYEPDVRPRAPRHSVGPRPEPKPVA